MPRWCVVDGVAGVEVQTEKVWSFAEEFNLPRAFFINKLDRERSDFERALEQHPASSLGALPSQSSCPSAASATSAASST